MLNDDVFPMDLRIIIFDTRDNFGGRPERGLTSRLVPAFCLLFQLRMVRIVTPKVLATVFCVEPAITCQLLAHGLLILIFGHPSTENGENGKKIPKKYT